MHIADFKMTRYEVAFAMVALLCVGISRTQAFTWEPCDKDKVPFTPDNVLLTPDPPVIGSQVLFSILGQNNVRDVPGGRITINVAFAGTPIYEEVDDLCSKTTCPITQGPINIQYSQDLPPIAPPGEYQVQVVARDTQDAEILCVLVTFDMVPPSNKQLTTPAPTTDLAAAIAAAKAAFNPPVVATSRKLLRATQ